MAFCFTRTQCRSPEGFHRRSGIGCRFPSLSAHKLRAPKGIGVLYVKTGVPFQPYIVGGGQERGQRGGTENVANIVAFGRAAELALSHLDDENTRVRALRDKLENGIFKAIKDPSATGEASQGCRTQRTSGSTASRLRRRCCCWIAKASAPRAARPAPPVPSSHPRTRCDERAPLRSKGSLRFSSASKYRGGCRSVAGETPHQS